MTRPRMTQSHPPSPVTVLAGFSPAATDAVARALLVTDPSLLLVQHDLTDVRAGVVRRTVSSAFDVLEDVATTLVHGCVSCTLREDVLPTLERLARERPGDGILLALPPAVEPEAVAAACASGLVRFDSFVTVVEAAGFLDDLASTDDLRDRGLHAADNDHRGVADVVVRQIEFADTLVVWGADTFAACGLPEHDAFERDRLITLLHRLAPWARQVRVGDATTIDCAALARPVLGTGRHDPSVPGMLGRAFEGYPIGVDDPSGVNGIGAVVFRSRRPFHPRRLHDALDDLTAESLRVRGLLWIASQPDIAIGWESAGGGVLLGNLGLWLAALPPERWAEASDLRRLAADADWDPYYGDRTTVLSFVGLGLDTGALTTRLHDCLLTDAELATGTAEWKELPDPFADFFPADLQADEPSEKPADEPASEPADEPTDEPAGEMADEPAEAR